jgi:rhomboid protease GluP
MLALDSARGGAGGRPLDLLAPSGETLLAFGALHPRAVLACGKVWLLFTPIFLHLGLFHFFFNTLALWQLGPVAEEAYGRDRFLVLYLGAGVMGNVASVFLGFGGGGASGAIFGLMGATLVFARRRRHAIGPALVYRWLLHWVLYAVLLSLFVRNVNHAAHGGGFVAGAALGFVADRSRATLPWRFAARAAVGATVLSFAVTALEAPTVLRGLEVFHLEGEVKGAWEEVHELSRSSGADTKGAASLRDAARRLRELRGLRGEIEAIRVRAADSLDALLVSVDDPERAEAAAAYRKTVVDLDAWLRDHACRYGLFLE